MNRATVIARYLNEAGVGHVFGYPGDPNVEVIEALPADAVVSADVGSHKPLVGQGWTTYRPGAAPDRPLVIGANIDPAQYAAQF